MTLTHPRPGEFAGTSCLEAAGDTQDLTAFYALVCEEAKQLGRLGDTDDYETRKAKALGIIAARQGALDLTDEPRRPRCPAAGADEPLRARLAGRPRHPCRRQPGIGEVEKLGPATLDLIRTWLDDSKAKIQPVLDLNRTDAVDQHDPPPWMREQVILRDRHCVFPWCGRDARTCDLDHIVPYVPPDEGGPPGQTNPQNLAPLCRRHHRAKTFNRWRYERTERRLLRLDLTPPEALPRQRHRHPRPRRALSPARAAPRRAGALAEMTTIRRVRLRVSGGPARRRAP